MAELVSCKSPDLDIAGQCVGAGEACTEDAQCKGAGMMCKEGRCAPMGCNTDPSQPGEMLFSYDYS